MLRGVGSALDPGFTSVRRLEDRDIQPHSPAGDAVGCEHHRFEFLHGTARARSPGLTPVPRLDDRAIHSHDPARGAVVR